MTKEEFLKNLRKKLSILEESEIEDIISEYEGYIEEKMSKGSTEQEAVESMGNVSELARDLLSAYKIKSPSDKTKDTFNNIADGCINVFERIVDTFAHKSFQEILRFIFELCFIFLIIAICKLPFEIIESLGRNAFYALGGTTFRVLSNIWECILEFVYLVFSILFFIKIFESRYLDDFCENVKVNNKETKKEDVVVSKGKKKETEEQEEEKQEKQPKIKKERVRPERTFNVIDSLVDLCMLFIKFIAFFILIGVVFYVVGMSLTIGLSLYFVLKGVFYFGIYLILISLFVLGIIAFIYLFNFIFNHKTKVGVLLILSLICFVILGIGVGVCAIEFASTTIVYNEEKEKNATIDYEYEMKENLVLAWDLESVKIDDSLDNKIRFEYKYNDSYFQIDSNQNINHQYGYEVLYYWYHVEKFTYKKSYLDKFLQDLKNKTIYIYSDNVEVNIYMSQKTYDKLLENKRNYDNTVRYRDTDIEEICEDLDNMGYSLPSYCKPNYEM